MEFFTAVISRIGVLFSFILIGFILKRGNFIPKEATVVFSRMENKVFMPSVVINTFWTNCTLKNVSTRWMYIVYSSVLLIICIIAAYIISRYLSNDEYIRKVYRYSLSVSNFGFVGTAMIQGIYGAESVELFDYMMFTLPLNLFTYSIGISWLIPNKKSEFSIKTFINPIFIALVTGAVLGLTEVPKTDFISSIISGAANCMSPIAMILTGIVIGSYELKSLLSYWQNYVITGIRLVGLPLLFVLVLKAIKAPSEIIIVTLCANAMPLGLNTVIIPSAYGENPRIGAGLALVSQIAAVVTIPVLFLLLV